MAAKCSSFGRKKFSSEKIHLVCNGTAFADSITSFFVESFAGGKRTSEEALQKGKKLQL